MSTRSLPATLARALASGAAFGLGACAVAFGLAYAAVRFAGYPGEYLIDKTAEVISARVSVDNLDTRTSALEQQIVALQSVPQRVVQSPQAPPKVMQAAPRREQPAPSVPAAQLPPQSVPPTPKFARAAKVTDAALLPQTKVPTFSGMDRTTPDVCLDGSCRFQSLADAYRAVADGSAIVMAPGLYLECIEIKKNIAIVGLKGPGGTRPTFNQQCGGKAAFILSADKVLLKGIKIDGIKVRDRNGACARLQGKDSAEVFAFVDVICSNSENGIMGPPGANAGVIIKSSLFSGNGANRGRSHGIYVVSGKEVLIENSIITSTTGRGHSAKVGAQRLVVKSSIIAALDGTNSRAIDFFGGGVLSVTDSVIQQGSNSENHDMIALAMERNRLNLGTPHMTSIRDSWLIFDHPGRCCRWLLQGEKLGEVVISGTSMVAINDTKVDPDREIGVERFRSRAQAGLPAYDGTLRSLPRPAAWGR